MKFTMNITQEIIDKGKCKDSLGCAFSLAYNELVPRVHVIGYLEDGIIFYDHQYQRFCAIGCTPKQRDFIADFDANKSVSPTTFEVEIPDAVIEYWYGDSVKAVQHLIDKGSRILKAVV